MNVIREEREKQGLSRDELAYQAQVSLSTVIRAEDSPKRINKNNLKRICARLGLSIDQVLASANS